MSVVHLFIAIIILLAISVILSIINWILQIGLSSRITLLEKELEKKTAEFDALKKERFTPAIQSHPVPPAVDMATRLDIPMEPQCIDDGEIRVVRNVRGTFRPVEEEPQPSHSPENDPVLETSRIAPISEGENTLRSTPSHHLPDDTLRENPAPRHVSERPHGPIPQQARPPSSAIVMPVFSAKTGGADFNALYESLIAVLKKSSNQPIAFDCGGIQYLSEDEIEYLGKIYRSLVSQGRQLYLIHCSHELKMILNGHRELAATVR